MANLSALKTKKGKEAICLLVLAALSYFAFFWRLGVLPVELYDEGRQAVSSFEMGLSGNIWDVTYNGRPELWNTKPPFLLWIINISTYLFGNNLIALRLPTALAGLAGVFVTYGFVKQQTQNITAALITAIVLLSSWGFIGIHAARTADYDSFLALWILLYSIYSYRFLHSIGNAKKNILWAAFYVFLAIFTKGVAALLPLPGLFVYAVLTSKVKHLLSYKWLYISGTGVLALTAAYYLFRESRQPGHLIAIWNNELFGRFAEVNEGHAETWYYYLENFSKNRFTYYCWLFICAALAGWFTIKNTWRTLYVFALVFALTHLVVISVSKTRLQHYDVPEYPFFAIVIGLFFSSLFQYKLWVKYLSLSLLLLCVALSFTSIANTINTLGNNIHRIGMYARYFKKMETQKPNLKSFTAYCTGNNGYNSVLDYYRLVYNYKGYKIEKRAVTRKTMAITKKYTVGDTIVTCDDGIINYLQNTYTTESLFADEYCVTLVLKSIKKSAPEPALHWRAYAKVCGWPHQQTTAWFPHQP